MHPWSLLMAASERNEVSAVEVRFPPDDIEELDAWIAENGAELTRPDAIKRIVKSAMAIDREWRSAKRAVSSDADAKGEPD
jgi:hypothetical protein